jgi:hypothetical protein
MVAQSIVGNGGASTNARLKQHVRFWSPMIVSAICGAIVMACCVFLVYYQRSTIRALVRIGMSEDETRAAVGEPDIILEAGAILERWGSGAERRVEGKTWIYCMFPLSANRAVVTFLDNRVAGIEFQYN